MSDHSSQRVLRFAIRYLSGTMLSRLSGLLRDITLAFCFGATPAIAGFMVAYRLAFLFRRLFGEGLLTQGFIPYFESARLKSPEKALEFFRDLFFSIALSFGVVLFLLVVALLFWGQGEIPLLTVWMIPGVFFICLYGITMAFLQAHQHFFLSALAPAFANITWIFGSFFLLAFPKLGFHTLAMIVSIGFFLQWVLVWQQAHSFFPKQIKWWRPQLFSSDVRKLAAPLSLGVLGVAALQINSAVDALFARVASLEGPAFLWYAIRIQQLPLALIGLALSSALLPELSQLFEREDQKAVSDLMEKSIHRVVTVMIPCTVALLILAPTGINLLYGRGDFSSHDVIATTHCLWGYGLGLLPAALIQVMAPAFYAKKDFRTPAFGFILSALCNIALDAIFVFGAQMGAVSIALATSCATYINLFYLAAYWRKQRFPAPRWHLLLNLVLLAMIAGGTTLFFGSFFWEDPVLPMLLRKSLNIASDFPKQCAQFGLQTGVLLTLFLGCFAAIITKFKIKLK